MEGDTFFNIFLDSLKLCLNSVKGNTERDLSFVHFLKRGNNTFIVIEDYILESLVVLVNLLSEEKIIFSCGIIYEENVIVGIEVCINSLDLERFGKW
ncbi:hypothetical protein ACHBHM_09380 [Streptococcus sp. A18]|uniref:hypothetical protein n=1 Tax=unclassified Streptococcus TaxID=2608887 RepID=UPI00374CB89D